MFDPKTSIYKKIRNAICDDLSSLGLATIEQASLSQFLPAVKKLFDRQDFARTVAIADEVLDVIALVCVERLTISRRFDECYAEIIGRYFDGPLPGKVNNSFELKYQSIGLNLKTEIDACTAGFDSDVLDVLAIEGVATSHCKRSHRNGCHPACQQAEFCSCTCDCEIHEHGKGQSFCTNFDLALRRRITLRCIETLYDYGDSSEASSISPEIWGLSHYCEKPLKYLWSFLQSTACHDELLPETRCQLIAIENCLRMLPNVTAYEFRLLISLQDRKAILCGSETDLIGTSSEATHELSTEFCFERSGFVHGDVHDWIDLATDILDCGGSVSITPETDLGFQWWNGEVVLPWSSE